MSQLVKLENYISRYQQDPFHYPSQYIRLKQENWKHLLDVWKQEQNQILLETPDVEYHLFDKWRKRFAKRTETDVIEESSLILPQNEEQLKQYFLDSLFNFQLKWASSTISQMSFLDRDYFDDFTLKYLLQRFPDTYLFMYKPIFKLKNAEIETDIVLIAPFEVLIIKIVEFPLGETVIAEDDRSWLKEEKNIRSKFMSPLISLKRSDKLIRSILNHKEIDMPVKKVVLSRTNKIEFHLEPYQTEFIDKDHHEDWVQSQRQTNAPLKHNQLKVLDALLTFSDTVSFSRPEWQATDSDDFSFE
ncbi:nuclease-like protein [Streptohalobacillus salinus]|uniref:Nuclease-like protein n=1 Tax=Streptohalobacillus salinus TaxID=621096 RepID=A0A2V3W3A7_9BACI|nr:nuclease-related domain-containing protein [Streptohalobacillus salinus]PXW88186.1 nuclease-like protein [Streptohalobacillus salinus]